MNEKNKLWLIFGFTIILIGCLVVQKQYYEEALDYRKRASRRMVGEIEAKYEFALKICRILEERIDPPKNAEDLVSMAPFVTGNLAYTDYPYIFTTVYYYEGSSLPIIPLSLHIDFNTKILRLYADYIKYKIWLPERGLITVWTYGDGKEFKFVDNYLRDRKGILRGSPNDTNMFSSNKLVKTTQTYENKTIVGRHLIERELINCTIDTCVLYHCKLIDCNVTNTMVYACLFEYDYGVRYVDCSNGRKSYSKSTWWDD